MQKIRNFVALGQQHAVFPGDGPELDDQRGVHHDTHQNGQSAENQAAVGDLLKAVPAAEGAHAHDQSGDQRPEKILRDGRFLGDGFAHGNEVHHTDAQILINTTPCGMFPYPDGNEERAGTPIDLSRFPTLSGVVDAIYNPLRPNLILDARERGIPAEGGLLMLVAQAIRAVEIFLGTELDHGAATRVCDEIRVQKENIVLTGMPGSGKSTVGQALAETLGRPLFDCDAEIVKKAGKPITEIFAEVGERGFRDIETEVVREIAANHVGCIISTGGGAILRDENIRALKRNGRLYVLDRPLELLLPTPDRPLSSDNEALRRRHNERYERYCATCDVRIPNGGTPDEAIAAIRKDFFHEALDH